MLVTTQGKTTIFFQKFFATINAVLLFPLANGCNRIIPFNKHIALSYKSPSNSLQFLIIRSILAWLRTCGRSAFLTFISVRAKTLYSMICSAVGYFTSFLITKRNNSGFINITPQNYGTPPLTTRQRTHVPTIQAHLRLLRSSPRHKASGT